MFSPPPTGQPFIGIPRCGECGALIRGPTKIILCALCHKPLCPQCAMSGLCPGHYSILTQEDRVKIDEISRKIKTYQKWSIVLSILPIGIFLPLMIIIMSGAFDGILESISGFPFFFLVLCCPGFGFSNSVRRKIVLLMQERDVLLAPYQGMDVPPNMTNINSYGQNIPSQTAAEFDSRTSFSPRKPLDIKELTADGQYCANCGKSSPPLARFCLNCGKRL